MWIQKFEQREMNFVFFGTFQRSKKSKSKRVEGQPKRAQTAFLIFINDKREQIKNENPGIKVTDISKKGGEMWRELKDKSVGRFTHRESEYGKLNFFLFDCRNGKRRPTKTRSGMLKK